MKFRREWGGEEEGDGGHFLFFGYFLEEEDEGGFLDFGREKGF